MNLTETILDQVSGDSLGKLSSLINADGDTTRTAIRASVPTILSALASVAANKGGAKKLASTLDAVDFGNLTHMLGGDTGSLVQKGSGLLSSLLGDGMTSSIANAIGRFTGLGADAVKKLLAALLPSIVGLVGSQWKSRGGTPESLANLFAEQKADIAEAMPDGFSLTSIPGLATTESAVRKAGETIRMPSDTARRGANAVKDTTQSAVQWLLPVAAPALVVSGLWWLFASRRNAAEEAKAPVANRRTEANDDKPLRTTLRPELPEPAKVASLAAMSADLKNVFSGALVDLSSVDDATSAAAALPKLTSINKKIDAIRDSLDQLPESGKAALGKLVGEQIIAFKEQAAKSLAIPGVAETLRPVVDQIVSKLAGLNLAQVSQDASNVFASLTKSLEGIKNRATVQEALPELEQLADKVDELARVQASMSPGGQSMLAKVVEAERWRLEELISTVMTRLGADASVVKPIFDDILNKLTSLTKPQGQSI